MDWDRFAPTRTDVAGGMLAFAQLLRGEYGISAGHAQAYEALRALEAVGIGEETRVRCALRSVFCGKRDDLEPFDRAFDAFFGGAPRGTAQPRPRPAGEEAAHRDMPVQRREAQMRTTSAERWRVLQARYSPSAAHAREAPAVSADGLGEMLADASRLIVALRLGRSRRWKRHVRGSRFDLRGTLRSSLQTGGDPARIRTLGHPLRNPRIVLFLDASRSMADYAPALLQFAHALCRRSRRASVFVFSTALREITRDLRAPVQDGARPLDALGEAWGGGTRIGACLREFLRGFGSRLNADTLVVVASDGLDAGEVPQLERALREISRRTAGIVWLNPHAGKPGFEPAARGMQAALPYISALLDARDLGSLGAAARRIRR